MYKFDCLECGNAFNAKEKNRKFCQQSCASRYSGKRRFPKGLRDKNLTPKEIKFCLLCKSELSHNKKVYCDNKCQQNFVKNTRTKDDLLKLSNPALRRHLINLYGAKCMRENCGWCEVHPITGTVPIELNHIDGNADNKEASNLELLCPNHHSLTPNYRNLNKGNGRSKRMERYRQGKNW